MERLNNKLLKIDSIGEMDVVLIISDIGKEEKVFCKAKDVFASYELGSLIYKLGFVQKSLFGKDMCVIFCNTQEFDELHESIERL